MWIYFNFQEPIDKIGCYHYSDSKEQDDNFFQKDHGLESVMYAKKIFMRLPLPFNS